MIKQSNILLLDAGNTRLKWAWVRESLTDGSRPGGDWLAEGACRYEDFAALAEAWAQIGLPVRVFGANVAGVERVKAVEQYWRQRGILVEWANTQVAICGVHNSYQSPEQLGVDRWSALVGAWRRVRKPCLVVSAGTALTVDSLDANGEFLGGMILPGRQMMQASLLVGTHAVATVDGEVADYPRNTADAVATGIAVAMIGAVQKAYVSLSAMHGSAPECLLTGGDAAWLSSLLPFGCTIAPRLVLEGLREMLLEERKK